MGNGKINQWINKIGLDKLCHLFLAGWVTTFGLSIAWWTGILFALIITLLEIIKEKKLDEKFDTIDVIYTEAGCVIAFFLKILQCLIL